ncbi:MAG: nuclear transport factor 2 family protein, partial [Dermatophilaceae bacterium]
MSTNPIRHRHARTVAAAVSAITLAGMAASSSAASAATDAGERHPSERCSTRVEERNLAAFQDYLTRLQGGDIDGAQAYFADGAVVEVHGSVPFAGTYEATDEYIDMMTSTWQPPSGGGEPAPPELYADCDQLILRGEFDRISLATGEALETTVIEYFTFEAGTIVRDDFYFTDTQAVNDAL